LSPQSVDVTGYLRVEPEPNDDDDDDGGGGGECA
jgi:hypothetical protein